MKQCWWNAWSRSDVSSSAAKYCSISVETVKSNKYRLNIQLDGFYYTFHLLKFLHPTLISSGCRLTVDLKLCWNTTKKLTVNRRRYLNMTRLSRDSHGNLVLVSERMRSTRIRRCLIVSLIVNLLHRRTTTQQSLAKQLTSSLRQSCTHGRLWSTKEISFNESPVSQDWQRTGIWVTAKWYAFKICCVHSMSLGS